MAVRATYRVEAKLSDTVDQSFDEEIADFDAVTPTWDKEVDAVGDFDAEQDVDGDLYDASYAAHDGPVGIVCIFDDANAAYGVMNASAVNQTSGVFNFKFHKSDLAIEDGKYIQLGGAVSGTNAYTWYWYLFNEGGTYKIRIAYSDDAAAFHWCGAAQEITTGYKSITIMWKRSTGAGNNDGWMRLYVHNVLKVNDTGHDNDTKDWDTARLGMAGTNSTTFGGRFYIDTLKIDPVGAPMADKIAAKNGSYGLSFPVMDTTNRRGRFTNPDSETVVMAECWIDPNTLTMAANDAFIFVYAPSGFALGLKYSGGYKIYANVDEDGGSDNTSEYLITNAPHHICIYWGASTGAGNDDGFLYLYIDHVLKERITGLDNDTLSVNDVYFGAASRLDAGTYGIFYMDDCKWGPWADITSDVIEDIVGGWGIWDNNPLDRLADTGAMRIILNNELGKYLPGLTGALDGFKKGTPIRLRFSYDDLDYIRFYGTIDTLDPEPGAHIVDKARIEVTDWMDYAAIHPMISPTIGVDQRADEMLTTLVADMPIAPLATDYDTGINTFPTSFDGVTVKTKAYTELNKIVLSEIGYIYLQKDPVYGETLVFENAECRNGLRTPDFTSDDTMTSLEVEYGENVINRFASIIYPRYIDAAAVVLFDLEDRQIIGSGQTIVFRGNYSEPVGGAPVSGTEIVTPVIGTDYDIWTNEDGTGTDIKADLTVGVAKGAEGTTFTLTNGNANAGWVWIRIRGKRLYTYNPIEYAARDTASIDEYGYKTITFRQRYKRSLTRGSIHATAVVEQEKQPRLKLNKVSFVANRTDALMTAWLAWDVGNMCYLKNTDYNIDEYAYIQGVQFTISPGGLVKFSWVVKGMLSVLLGLSLISAECDAASTDGIDYGYLPQISENAASTRSFSAWIYLHTNPPASGPIIAGPFSDTAGAAIFVTDNWGAGTRAIMYYQKGTLWPGIWETPIDSFALNTWVHVLATRDASAAGNAPVIYINGVSQALNNSSVQNGATASEIGCHFFVGNLKTATVDWGYPFDGVIKDVRAYDVILTQAEATSLAAGGNVTRGMVFQGPCVRTKDLDYFEDRTLTAVDRLIDNMYGCVGVPNNSVITRLIP